jgi:transposase
MDYFAGLDVSVKETSICIVDDAGRIVGEVKVVSEPEALLKVLGDPGYRFKRIGLEAGPLSQWLFSALAEAGLPVVCVETRQVSLAGRHRARSCLFRFRNPVPTFAPSRRQRRRRKPPGRLRNVNAASRKPNEDGVSVPRA